MTDDLKRLRDAMQSATPSPDPAAKATALERAQKNFNDLQGSGEDARLTSNRPKGMAGILTGVKSMFANIGLRPALYATSSLAVVGFGVILVQPFDQTPQEIFSPKTVVTTPELALDPQREGTETDFETADVVAEPLMQVEENMPRLRAELGAASPAPSALNADRAISGLVFPADEDGFYIETESNERFANEEPNPLKITGEEPVSTFSIDVDTASYSFVRGMLMAGQVPPPDAVRIEEMVNYFPYDYPVSAAEDGPFSTSVSVLQTPWNAETKIVHIGIQGMKASVDDRPPLDLVFLIDTSGSMQDPDKLPLLKQSFRLLLSKLSPQDQVAIVTYAGSAGTVLEPTDASNTQTILAALERLHAGGSTAGQAGLQQAYSLAAQMGGEDRVARVILATDGDFNVGISDPEELKTYIAKKRDSGTYLSVLGFGRGNTNDALMQSLAQNGNGIAAYIDTLSEAQKVLVDQVSAALFPIANDVKIQVEFNPATVAEYRLIGYETRALAREDFNNDAVDAGDIGAGHSVTAIYEITPVGSAAIKSDPLRYQVDPVLVTNDDEYGHIKLRYKLPGESVSTLLETSVGTETTATSQDAGFAVAIAGFGQLLRSDKYLGDWDFDDAISLANANKGADPYGYRAEAVQLMRLAETLSQN